MSPAETVARSEVIIFDLFHTLVSFKSDGTPGGNTSDILGIPEADWNRLLWESSDERLRHDHQDDISIIRKLALQHDATIAEEKIQQAAEARAQRFSHLLEHPPAGKVDILRRLGDRGHRLVLLSNADSMERRGWEKSPFAPLFREALFSCDIGHVKPEPGAYQEALRRCGAAAEQAVFVGDGGSNELRGAKVCGITTVMTTEIIARIWPELVAKRAAEADHIIGNLSELL